MAGKTRRTVESETSSAIRENNTTPETNTEAEAEAEAENDSDISATPATEPEQTESRPAQARPTTPPSTPITPLKRLLQDTDVLLMLYPKNKEGDFSEEIASEDEITVYDLLKMKQNKKNSLIVLLDTPGGSIYSAVKVIDCLRSHYTKISIAIPQEAKSSGSMMGFGANELIMSSISELGPLDKPMSHPDNENAYISALDIVRSVEGMLDTAMDREIEFAGKLRSSFGMRRKTSIELSNDYMSKLIAPMLSKEDIKIYQQARRLLAIPQKYGEEFLGKYMLSYISSDSLRNTVIDFVLRRFIWLYPDHGFAIRREELRDLFFKVIDAETLDYWDELWKEFEQNIGIKTKTIRFLDN